MAIVETIKVVDPNGGYKVINKKDFDPSIHKLATGKEPPALIKQDNKEAKAKAEQDLIAAEKSAAAKTEQQDQAEMKELVLLLDQDLASAPGLKNILDEEKYPKERLVELGALMKMERVNPMSYDQFRQKVLEAATKLLA